MELTVFQPLVPPFLPSRRITADEGARNGARGRAIAIWKITELRDIAITTNVNLSTLA